MKRGAKDNARRPNRAPRGASDGLAALLAAERWAELPPSSGGALRVLLAYPADYPVAAASLGYQAVYRLLRGLPGIEVDRAWLSPEQARGPGASPTLRGVASGRAASEFHLIAISMAWELEVVGLLELLHRAGLPALAEQRSEDDPAVLLGGPLTWASAAFCEPFADALLLGEAEDLLPGVMARLAEARGRRPEFLAALEGSALQLPGSSSPPPPLQQAGDEHLPAMAAWVSPAASFSDMFLVEAGRGCRRACGYCVLRRPDEGPGFRPAALERILAAVPPWAPKVGLVGAAVTDHPDLRALLRHFRAAGQNVGLSSLRADRLDEELVELLRDTGLRTLTTALDGASEALRRSLRRGTTAQQVLDCARLAKAAGIPRFKLYLMLGLPGEEPADIEECAALCRELSHILPLTLTLSPFVPKLRTPLAEAPFAGRARVEAHLRLLRQRLQGRAQLQSVSTGWAWVEARLAQGGPAAGHAALQAVADGGSVQAWQRALGPDPW